MYSRNKRPKIHQIRSDHYQIYLEDTGENGIRILQLTDQHMGKMGFWREDLSTLRRAKRLVEMHNPQIIALTGDLLTGEKFFGDLLCAFVTHFFDSLELPWLYVFGNHDPEGGMSHDQIAEIFTSSRWCVLGHHSMNNETDKKYDYKVELITGNSKAPVWEIYSFDSGQKSINSHQLHWYRQMLSESRNAYQRMIPAIALFHIPLRQYQDLWNDESIPKGGESREKVCYEEDDGTAYQTFVETGNIRATFCGHDHYNNYWGAYHGGIILAYGHIGGEATNWAWPTGGKLVTLSAGDETVEIKNVVPDF